MELVLGELMNYTALLWNRDLNWIRDLNLDNKPVYRRKPLFLKRWAAQSNATFGPHKPLASAERCRNRALKHIHASSSGSGTVQAVVLALQCWNMSVAIFSYASQVCIAQGLFWAGGRQEKVGPAGGAAQGVEFGCSC